MPSPGTTPGACILATLGPLWRPRYWLARQCINAGLALLPDSRYKRELLDLMWKLRWKVEAECAAKWVEDGGLKKHVE